MKRQIRKKIKNRQTRSQTRIYDFRFCIYVLVIPYIHVFKFIIELSPLQIWLLQQTCLPLRRNLQKHTFYGVAHQPFHQHR